tara:strand:- start:426 stop:566 length:141 start_codon:yes stop_codon:yes gene_type:complete
MSRAQAEADLISALTTSVGKAHQAGLSVDKISKIVFKTLGLLGAFK